MLQLRDTLMHVPMSLEARTSAREICQEGNEIIWEIRCDQLWRVVEDLMDPLDVVQVYSDWTLDAVALIF